MLVFWSLLPLVRNSVMLAVFLLFLVVCFFTAHKHSRKAINNHISVTAISILWQ